MNYYFSITSLLYKHLRISLCLFVLLIYADGISAQSTDREEYVYSVVEEQPSFPGGVDSMFIYIKKEMKYPEEARKNNVQGKVYVQFIVEKDGSLSNVHIFRGSNELLDKEAIRVIKSMPIWQPGIQRGKIVRVRFTVPVEFVLK